MQSLLGGSLSSSEAVALLGDVARALQPPQAAELTSLLQRCPWTSTGADRGWQAQVIPALAALCPPPSNPGEARLLAPADEWASPLMAALTPLLETNKAFARIFLALLRQQLMVADGPGWP